jgi:hypothetical protein
MYKYSITKVGRKWYEAESADSKKYKAQIEINDISDGWTVGSIVEFDGEMERKASGGFTKTFVYPRDKEIMSSKRNNAEIEKWLGYVELNAKDYVYKNGVENLKAFKLSDTQTERLNKAIKTGTINAIKKETYKYLGHIQDSYKRDIYWYEKGETVVLNNIKTLETLGENTSTFKSELQTLHDDFNKKYNEKLATEIKRCSESKAKYFEVQEKSYSKRDSYEIGKIIKDDLGNIGKVVKAYKQFVDEEDYLSIGLDEAGWYKCAKCDITAVSESELKDFKARQLIIDTEIQKIKDEEEKKQAYEKEVSDLIDFVKENGECPSFNSEKMSVYGDVIYNSFNIYGGGAKLIIDTQHKLWAIINNGTDGGDWGLNNVKTGGAGAIGYCIDVDKCNSNILK